MKRIIIVALLTAATIATNALGQTRRGRDTNNSVKETLITLERQLWKGWKDKDSSTFQKVLSQDSIGVGGSGVDNRATILRGISSGDCVVRSYSLENFQVVMLDKNTAILTYKATQDATCRGNTIPAMVWASSVFVRRNGRWQAAFHQETPATPTTTTQ